MADRYELRLPALRIRQGPQFIYTFGVDGKRIHDFATVSRVHRDDITLQGYQRPEVLSHIKAIRRYLESDGAMLPNAQPAESEEQMEKRNTLAQIPLLAGTSEETIESLLPLMDTIDIDTADSGVPGPANE